MTDYSTEFAPGPWSAREGYKGSGPWDRLTIEAANGNVLAVVNRDLPGAHANANIMAAAFDMLAALKNVRAYIKNCDHEPALDEIDAAIAKATTEGASV